MDEEVKVCPECSRALVADVACTHGAAVAEDIKEEIIAEETPKVEATPEEVPAVVAPSENGSVPLSEAISV